MRPMIAWGRVPRVLLTAVVTLAVLVVGGTLLHGVLLGLPYLLFLVLRIDDDVIMNGIVWFIWLLSPLLVAAATLVARRILRRTRHDGPGIVVGVVAYPVLSVALFSAAPETLVGSLAYMHIFSAAHISIVVSLVWLLRRGADWWKRREDARSGGMSARRWAISRAGRPPGL